MPAPPEPIRLHDLLQIRQYGLYGANLGRAAWSLQATVTGNNPVKAHRTFAPVATDRIRVNITATADGSSYIAEVGKRGR